MCNHETHERREKVRILNEVQRGIEWVSIR